MTVCLHDPCRVLMRDIADLHLATVLAGNMFHFTCFNTEDPDDPQVGLRNGDLTIPGNLLRQEVFDPVVKQVRSMHDITLHGCNRSRAADWHHAVVSFQITALPTPYLHRCWT